MTYHVDRFYAAVSVLAGDGHIKQRLMRAYQDNLDEISEEELPRQIKKPFSKLRRRMHRVAPLNGEGPICASVRKMSVHEASDCAVSVVSLYSEIIRQAGELQDPLPVQGGQDGVPPFLVKSAS
ncbi:MAG: hypothetical protein ACR2QX_08965 [Woeseiaceae bacterium]